MWAIGMAGAAGNGAPVHAAGDQLGDHEVPQIMQPASHAEPTGEAAEPMGDAIRVDRR
jgi:hypothetical protein